MGYRLHYVSTSWFQGTVVPNWHPGVTHTPGPYSRLAGVQSFMTGTADLPLGDLHLSLALVIYKARDYAH